MDVVDCYFGMLFEIKGVVVVLYFCNVFECEVVVCEVVECFVVDYVDVYVL